MKINKAVFTLTSLSLLIALEVVLSRFLSFSVWNQKIGFAFVATAVSGMMFGPLGGAVVGGLADFVGAILFPIGAYFPGFTLTNAILGAIFGLMFYVAPKYKLLDDPKIHLKTLLDKNTLILGIWSFLCAFVNLLLCTLLLNSLWISILYKTPIRELVVTRIVQCAIMIPVQTLFLPFLFKISIKLKQIIK